MLWVYFYVNTHDQAYLLVSVYSVYGLFGSGNLSIGSLIKASLSNSKEACHLSDHSNSWSSLVRLVKGLATSANLGTNFL